MDNQHIKTRKSSGDQGSRKLFFLSWDLLVANNAIRFLKKQNRKKLPTGSGANDVGFDPNPEQISKGSD
jgi:hypothetical protein